MNEHSADALRFREAMSRVAHQVHVVTTDGPAGRHGATATSVASLTDAPPTLIVCLNRGSTAHRIATRNGILAINALAARHEPLARAFAASSRGRDDGRFAHGRWDAMATGAPTLVDAVATFDGRILDETTIGTHSALFVTVEATRFAEPAMDGLFYHRRAWRGGA